MPPTAPTTTQPLEALASVRSGYAPRRYLVDPFGAYRGLQVRDLARDMGVDWTRLEAPRVTGDATRYELRDGDLVVSLRGAPRAWRIHSPPERVIVVGQLAIVTPRADSIDPDYLSWYLNHPATTAELRALARGTSLSFVSMAELRALRVPLPPLATQRAIGRTAVLAGRQELLQAQLAAANRRRTDVQLLRVARTR